MEGDVAGDFYDVIDLKDGRVAVVVGDAPGFGVRAASIAEDLRGELRHAFYETSDAAAVLTRLNHRLGALGDDDLIATAACAVIDPAGRQLEIASAGHLPVICADATGVRLLDAGSDPPLGIEASRTSVHFSLSSEATFFVYTDGLVERRGTSLASSIDELLGACAGLHGASAWASELARRTTVELGPPSDDATVVSVRVLAPAITSEPAHARFGPRERVVLAVFLDPADPRSHRSMAVVNDLAYRLRDVVDIHVETVDITAPSPDIERHGVIAAPTIVRVSPNPPIRVIGGQRSIHELAAALQLPHPMEDE